MSRPGHHRGLGQLHASGCDGNEAATCRPIVLPAPDTERGATLEVVVMGWCVECGAADYEVV